MERNLKPCPFCGNSGERVGLLWDSTDNSRVIMCFACGARTAKAYVRKKSFRKIEPNGKNFKNDTFAENWITTLWNTRFEGDPVEFEVRNDVRREIERAGEVR